MIRTIGIVSFFVALVIASSVSLAESGVCELRDVETLSTSSCRIESLEIRAASKVTLDANHRTCLVEFATMMKTLDRSKCPPQPPNNPYDVCAQAAFDCASHDDTGHRCDHFYKFERKSVLLDKSKVKILRGGVVISAGSCRLQVQKD